MAMRKSDDKEFQRDMNKYLDKASKSSTRFINLHEKSKKPSKSSKEPSEESTTILIKEKTPFEHFLYKLSKIFSPKKKKEKPKEELVKEVEEMEEIEEKSSEDEDFEEIEKEEKSHKRSFFSWLFTKKEEEEIEEIDMTHEDMRKLAIFTKELLKKISHEEFTKLKIDGKVDEFKEILKRNNLIKQ